MSENKKPKSAKKLKIKRRNLAKKIGKISDKIESSHNYKIVENEDEERILNNMNPENKTDPICNYNNKSDKGI